MLKRLLSFVLAMTLFFTAVVPAALAEELSEAELQAQYAALAEKYSEAKVQAQYNELLSEFSQDKEKEDAFYSTLSGILSSMDEEYAEMFNGALSEFGIDTSKISEPAEVKETSVAEAPASSVPHNTHEYTMEMKPGETKTITNFEMEDQVSGEDIVHLCYVKQPVSADSSIATAQIERTTKGLADYLTITVNAHSPGSTEITWSDYMENLLLNPNTWCEEWQIIGQSDHILCVTVTKELNPPKVEVRLVPDSTVKQVTGVHQAVDFLDTALNLLNPISAAGLVIEKVIPPSSKAMYAVTKPIELVRDVVKDFKPTPQEQARIDSGSKKYTTSRKVRLYFFTFVSKNKSLYLPFFPKPKTLLRILPTVIRFAVGEIAQQSVLWLLKKVKVPRLEPEVSLEVVVTNPDNTVPLYYDMSVDSPRVANSSIGCIPFGAYTVPPTDAYSEQIIHPGSEYRNVHKFKLNPEWVFNEASIDQQRITSYSSNITVSGSWGEYKGDGKEPGGQYEESAELNVISTLGPKSEYQQLERFFSDAATHVFNVLEYISQLFQGPQPLISDQAWIDLLDSLPVGAPLMTPVDQIPPPSVISAQGSSN